MKKILGLSVAALMVMGLVGGGTWAYFNDIEAITGNTIAAGTLYLDINQGSAVAFSFSDIAPTNAGVVDGPVEASVFTITNNGTLSGNLTIGIGAITNTEGTPSSIQAKVNDAGAPGELGGYLKLAAFIDTNSDGNLDDGEFVLKSDGTVIIWSGGDNVDINSAAAETAGAWATVATYGSKTWSTLDLTLDPLGGAADSVDLVIWSWFPHGATTVGGGGAYAAMYQQNDAQGDSVDFDITILLEQADQS